MIVSMTGCSQSRCVANGTTVVVEIKAWNHRYLKLVIRLEDRYAQQEPVLESLIRETIFRGAVTLQVRVASPHQTASHKLNTVLLKSLLREMVDLKSELGITTPTSLESFLAVPDALIHSSEISEISETYAPHQPELLLIEQATREAIAQFQQMRQREGAEMATYLRGALVQLEQYVKEVAARAPQVPEAYRQRLLERITSLLERSQIELAPADTAREVALFADKCDITEEIVRLQSHLKQFATSMTQEDQVGRKLDFLLQEMFREVNTMGAKANDGDITHTVVEMKNLLEKMREVVQNIE